MSCQIEIRFIFRYRFQHFYNCINKRIPLLLFDKTIWMLKALSELNALIDRFHILWCRFDQKIYNIAFHSYINSYMNKISVYPIHPFYFYPHIILFRIDFNLQFFHMNWRTKDQCLSLANREYTKSR